MIGCWKLEFYLFFCAFGISLYVGGDYGNVLVSYLLNYIF